MSDFSTRKVRTASGKERTVKLRTLMTADPDDGPDDEGGNVATETGAGESSGAPSE